MGLGPAPLRTGPVLIRGALDLRDRPWRGYCGAGSSGKGEDSLFGSCPRSPPRELSPISASPISADLRPRPRSPPRSRPADLRPISVSRSPPISDLPRSPISDLRSRVPISAHRSRPTPSWPSAEGSEIRGRRHVTWVTWLGYVAVTDLHHRSPPSPISPDLPPPISHRSLAELVARDQRGYSRRRRCCSVRELKTPPKDFRLARAEGVEGAILCYRSRPIARAECNIGRAVGRRPNVI